MINERFTVKPQDDVFGVTDNNSGVNVVNGIPTEIEAEWLCNTLNELNNENQQLKERIKNYPICYTCKYCFRDDWYGVCCENEECEHYTRDWELELQTECKHYELKEEEDDEE